MIFTKFNPQRIENKINRLLRSVGIGSGSSVLESGEEFILDILKKHTQPPFCIFDVGANQGQYLDMCLKYITGGGGGKNHFFVPSQ